MFVVLTYTSDIIVYFVRALRDALSKIYTFANVNAELGTNHISLLM